MGGRRIDQKLIDAFDLLTVLNENEATPLRSERVLSPSPSRGRADIEGNSGPSHTTGTVRPSPGGHFDKVADSKRSGHPRKVRAASVTGL